MKIKAIIGVLENDGIVNLVSISCINIILFSPINVFSLITFVELLYSAVRGEFYPS